MRILILNPPSKSELDHCGRWPAKVTGGTIVEPLFLAYTAAVLEKEGKEVELLDCPALKMNQEELIQKIDREVELVVIQTATPSIKEDLGVARAIKNKFPEIKIALVGPHVSVLDEEILRENNHIDFIARGEYEYTIRDLAECLAENKDIKDVLGITFRDNNEIIRNEARPYIENLDELPFPARHFLPMDVYFEPVFKSSRTFRLFGSRGCSYQCTFCLWPQTMFGRRIRLRDPKKIVDEIEQLVGVYGAKGIYFEDDTFTAVPQYVFGVCNELLERKIKIPWSCLGRIDCLNEKMLEKMKEAGCLMIRYGPESSSQEILNKAKKGITVEQIIKAFEMTKKAGIESYADYLLGLPGETKETLKETINFAIKLDSDYAQFPIVTPYPGTELYREALKNGWLRSNDWSDFDASGSSVLEYPNLKAKEIEEASKKAYRNFYLRPSYVIKKALKIRSFKEIPQLVRGGINLITNSFFK